MFFINQINKSVKNLLTKFMLNAKKSKHQLKFYTHIKVRKYKKNYIYVCEFYKLIMYNVRRLKCLTNKYVSFVFNIKIIVY